MVPFLVRTRKGTDSCKITSCYTYHRDNLKKDDFSPDRSNLSGSSTRGGGFSSVLKRRRPTASFGGIFAASQRAAGYSGNASKASWPGRPGFGLPLKGASLLKNKDKTMHRAETPRRRENHESYPAYAGLKPKRSSSIFRT